MDYLQIGSDNVVIAANVLDILNDGTAVLDATGSGELLNADGTSLDTFTYTYDGSETRYEAVIPASVTEDLTEGAYYTIKTTFLDGGGTVYGEQLLPARVLRFT